MNEPVLKKAKYDNHTKTGVLDPVKSIHEVKEASDLNDFRETEVLLSAGEVNPNPIDILKSSKDLDNDMNNIENDVGMSLVINKLRFSGIIKQRYSDFMVRECGMDGSLTYLSSLEHIDDIAKVEPKNTMNSPERKLPLECPITDPDELQKIESFISDEDKTQTLTLCADDDKEHRKLVHFYIKQKYADIETDTVLLENQSRAIRLAFKTNDKSTRRNTERNSSRNLIPKYCHFVLFKQNMDTMACINLLSKMLRINPGNFSYAGTKDRRATTIQRISVQKTLSKRLANLNSRLFNAALGNFSYSETGLRLGDLKGNEFTLVIRNVDQTKEYIDEACKSLQSQGFINYFGLQRFGTGAVPTHEIGKALLSSRFGDAVDMILKPRGSNDGTQHSSEIEAQTIWMDTKDPQQAYDAVKQKHSIEGKLLHGLVQRGGRNFLDAMKAIPRNTRLLYIHSYQSLIWNKAVSRRIEEYGFKAQVGDLILTGEKDENGYEMIRTVTEDDTKNETVSIYDIVLPLPGYDMTYPTNNMYEFYKKSLADDGLDIDDMRRKQKELSLSGKYRKILVNPKNMTWEVIHYEDFKTSLIENDLEKLKKESGNEESNKEEENKVNEGNGNGSYLALKLQMTLPPSCYATTALRELLTGDASYKTQVELNKNS